MIGAAAVCNPGDLQGVYGFQLTGTATIGRGPQPVVSLGRLVFGSDHTVNGVSSLTFTGLYLGNPVTGMYDAQADCSVSWTLQHDSGNYQHLTDTMTGDGSRAEVRQEDPIGHTQGVLVKTAAACRESDFQARYRYSLAGQRIDVNTGQVDGSVSASGSLNRHGNQVTLTPAGQPDLRTTGDFAVDSDCFVDLDLTVPDQAGGTFEMKFRGILVNGGNELLGMATDPGTAVSLRLTAE